MVKIYLKEDKTEKMVTVYLRQGDGTDSVTREINLPRVPSIGEIFHFMDGGGPELDYRCTVARVEYIIYKTEPRTGPTRKSKLEQIIVHLE